MGFEPAIAVFDASILYPFHLRNIVVQAAFDRIVEARWTDLIQDEWMRSLIAGARSIPREHLETTRQLMEKALPTARVRGYEGHIAAVNLPDPNDRHVVAAGITAGAAVILTWNLRHFPAKELNRFSLRKETPDSFLSDLHDRVPDFMIGSLANARRNLNKPKVSASDFIDILKNQKLAELARRARTHLRDL